MIASEIFDIIAPVIGDSGVCADRENGKMLIIRSINILTEALLKRLDAKDTLWFWELPVTGGCFPMPYDLEGARSVWLDGKTLTQRDEFWEAKLGVGLGDRLCPWNQPWVRHCNGADLVDLGSGFATPNTWPNHANTKLALVAESEGDAGKVVQIKFIDDHNIEQEEFITLLTNLQPAVSQGHVRGITFFHKPVTTGGIRAYVRYDHVGQFRERGLRTAFAYFMPRTTTANFHRMKLPAPLYGRGCCGKLLVKGKRKFMPIIEETDQLQITDTPALLLGAEAVAALYRKDDQDYQAKLANAVNELEKQKANSVSPAATAQASFSTAGSTFRRRAWN